MRLTVFSSIVSFLLLSLSAYAQNSSESSLAANEKTQVRTGLNLSPSTTHYGDGSVRRITESEAFIEMPLSPNQKSTWGPLDSVRLGLLGTRVHTSGVDSSGFALSGTAVADTMRHEGSIFVSTGGPQYPKWSALLCSGSNSAVFGASEHAVCVKHSTWDQTQATSVWSYAYWYTGSWRLGGSIGVSNDSQWHPSGSLMATYYLSDQVSTSVGIARSLSSSTPGLQETERFVRMQYGQWRNKGPVVSIGLSQIDSGAWHKEQANLLFVWNY